jgi:hypothetical protein
MAGQAQAENLRRRGSFRISSSCAIISLFAVLQQPYSQTHSKLISIKSGKSVSLNEFAGTAANPMLIKHGAAPETLFARTQSGTLKIPDEAE